MTNQCDGCRRGLPTWVSGLSSTPIHFNPDGSYDHIGCTAHLYLDAEALAVLREAQARVREEATWPTRSYAPKTPSGSPS